MYVINYRVFQNIGLTLFIVIFLGSGECAEELLSLFQQPWKFATLWPQEFSKLI